MNIYEETLKIARNLIKKDPSLTDWVISKFPELKKSEDEKSKKWILEYLHDGLRKSDEQFKTAIAWLEKQGGKDEEILILKDQIESLHAAIKAIKKTHRIELEKLGEQNLANSAKICKDEQKLATWSKEDEANLNIALSYIKDDALKEFVKSLKERVQPQPKQEWSEEDSYMLGQAIKCVNNSGKLEVSTEEIEYWLELLKPQKQWKPSDEHMKALNYVVNLMASSESPKENDYYYNVFKDLREQLKKLKEA